MKRGRLITVGSFDGVHRGHQALLARAVKEAHKRRVRSMAMTFAVPPKMVLDKNHVPSLLSTPTEKVELVRKQGIDDVKVLTFDKELSRCGPFYFFRDILVKQFKAKGIVVGYDFRFGANRSGGARDLVDWGLEYEIPVWVIPPVQWKGHTVSSSLIRSLIEKGHFQQASDFLNHPYLIQGKVVQGQKLGRKIGFPTINLKTGDSKILPRGVYAVRGVEGPRARRRFWGVCNIGVRPTVTQQKVVTVEVHVLKGAIPTTGQVVMIELLKHLRNEKRFSSLEGLKKAISADIPRARQAF